MKRRLLTIAHSYVVTLNRRLAQELARAGEWDVTAVAPTRYRGDFGWLALDAGTDEACDVRGVPVRGSRSAHLMRYGGAFGSILREPWDLVHCWEEPYVVAAWQVARGLPAGVPLVVATFQNIAKTYPPPFRWIEGAVMRRAAGVIAFGRTIEQTLAARGFGGLPTRVIPPGVDTALFRPDAARGGDRRRALGWTDGPVVGYVGRLVPEKGLAVLTAALDRVAAPWRALIVGSGPEEGAVRRWADRHPGRVALVTDAGHADVPAWLDAMDLLCAPSLSTPAWREQFGRMLIEALASGVPVVASDSGEIPFVVGDAAVVVPEGDVAAWAAAIEALLGDAPRRADLAARGRARAVEVYAWPVVARRHLQFFDELMGAPAAAAERAGARQRERGWGPASHGE